jgi:hypothetical protein
VICGLYSTVLISDDGDPCRRQAGIFPFWMPWAMVQLLVELEWLRIPISSISHKEEVLLSL